MQATHCNLHVCAPLLPLLLAAHLQAELMYRRNKEEVEGLQSKRKQVEDDKAQITAVIQQLDEKKRIALEETWKHVSVADLAV